MAKGFASWRPEQLPGGALGKSRLELLTEAKVPADSVWVII